MDRTSRRAAALQAAARLDRRFHRTSPHDVIATAEIFDAWLAGPLTATFTITADAPTARPTHGGPGMSLSLPDTQEVTLHIGGIVDGEGVTVTDTFTWAVDNPALLTLTPAPDTLSAVAVPGTAQGSATITVTASDGVARTFAIDVTAGPTAAFSITADTPVDRPAPTAAA